jgi:hypothetical protein
VDVYIPHNRITSWLVNDKVKYETLYYYDVNAFYPTVMSNKSMPIGKPTVFEGDISKIIDCLFGLFQCPMLQYISVRIFILVVF